MTQFNNFNIVILKKSDISTNFHNTLSSNRHVLDCWPADIGGSDDDAPVRSGQRVILHFMPHVVNV